MRQNWRTPPLEKCTILELNSGLAGKMSLIPRELEAELGRQLTEFPIVTVLGPRQAGKTTLVRAALPDYSYVTLEDPGTLELANFDPKSFLARHGLKVIFDEIQRAPHLLSYLQGIVDEDGGNGNFVLTGSHQLEFRATVSQSLAGRTGLLFLLPLSIAELSRAGVHLGTTEEYIFHGFLPRVHAQKQRPRIAYSNYYRTYVERDIRQLINLKDAAPFERFIKLLAGRVGQLINYDSLASDVGVNGKTIKSWLSILEASFVVFRLPPFYENFGKRVIKTPKYYFTDTGLLCYLLGIETAAQVSRDPLIGHLFECLVALEAFKSRFNQGREPHLYFFRDNHGHEIDLLFAPQRKLIGIECKSAATFHTSFLKGLHYFDKYVTRLEKKYVVYNGEAHTLGDETEAISVKDMGRVFQSRD